MIYMLLAEGFEEVEALAPLDLLRRAGKEILTVSITENRAVTGAHGITVLADITFEEIVAPCDEMLILPGGMPGTTNLDVSPVTHRLIDEVLENEGYLGAICAAPMILGRRGLLAGKQATCFPGFEKELRGAILFGEDVVVDGKIITAKGMPFAFAFGEALVALLNGQPLGIGVSLASPEEDKKHFYPDFKIDSMGDPEIDKFLYEAIGIAADVGRVSTSLLQRRMSIGFGKAAAIMDHMTKLGLISAPNGHGPRFVFLTREDYDAIREYASKNADTACK